MKRLKRALALTMAVLMILAMATISASAAEGDDTGNDEDTTITQGTVDNPIKELTVTNITKTVTVNVAMPTEEFYFQMAPVPAADIKGETAGGITVESGPELTTPVVSVHYDASDDTSTGSVTKKVSFDLTGIKFEHTGVYRYYVTQVVQTTSTAADGTVTVSYGTPPIQTDGKIHYITYDHTTYVVDLYVGQRVSDKSYYVSNTVVKYSGTNEKPSRISFTETVECSSIDVIKTVVGDEYEIGEYYTFYIMIPVGGDTIELKQGETLDAWIYRGSSIVKDDRTGNTGKLTITINGDDIDADVMTCGTKFQLRDGEHLRISAPVSMIYKVEEVVPVHESYDTTVDYTEYGFFLNSKTLDIKTGSNVTSDTTKIDDEDYKITCVRGTTNTETNRALFTNTRNMTPDTGVSLDFLPYALILLAAVVGFGLLIFFKKKRAGR